MLSTKQVPDCTGGKPTPDFSLLSLKMQITLLLLFFPSYKQEHGGKSQCKLFPGKQCEMRGMWQPGVSEAWGPGSRPEAQGLGLAGIGNPPLLGCVACIPPAYPLAWPQAEGSGGRQRWPFLFHLRLLLPSLPSCLPPPAPGCAELRVLKRFKELESSESQQSSETLS